MKSGAIKGGTYVKDKTVAGATYLKERDWSKEKEMAGKAGQATKTCALPLLAWFSICCCSYWIVSC